MVNELVIISGKGGTGKSSVAASFGVLAQNPIVADCDVDASNMHLLLNSKLLEKSDFYSGNEASIDQEKCKACNLCKSYCKFDAINKTITNSGRINYQVVSHRCEGCGLCAYICPEKAIALSPRLCGQWMISETKNGYLVHASLGIAAENSGKLVSTVREKAHELALTHNSSVIIIDGPPGIGCPVIASLTGTSLVLIVTEPTVSGEHDLERVLSLVRHFNLKAAVCVNKWDINEELTDRIERKAVEKGARVVPRIRYDCLVTQAQREGRTVVETNAPSGDDIKVLFNGIMKELMC